MSPPERTRARRGGTKHAPSSRIATGAISKRRAAGPKVDRDGDFDMDDADLKMAKRARPGRSKTNQPASSARSACIQNNTNTNRLLAKIEKVIHPKKASSARRSPRETATLKIAGLNHSRASSDPDGGEQRLVRFIEGKASKDKSTVTVYKYSVENDDVYIEVDKEQIPDVLRLNGIDFAGVSLRITEDTSPTTASSATIPHAAQSESSTTGMLKNKLREILSSRYNINTKVLDLSALGQDQRLAELGLLAAKDTAEKTFRALLTVADQQFKSAREKEEAIQNISLADNCLDSVTPVYDIAETFPRVKALDLSRNNIPTVYKLSPWRHRLRHLETLLLNDNPVIQTSAEHQGSLLQWFPRLQILNGAVVRTSAEIAAAAAAKKGTAIPQQAPLFLDDSGIAEQFIREFIPRYDAAREELVHLCYDQDSQFSFSLNTHAPRYPESQAIGRQPFTRLSRNLERLGSETERFKRLFEGAAVISKAFSELPKTKHPDLGDGSKYMIEAFPVSGLVDPTGKEAAGVQGLSIHISGEFEEIPQVGNQPVKRSFDRSFIIGPGRPDKGPIRVVSDMLSMRAWKPLRGQ